MLPDVVPINLWPDKEGAGDTNHHFYICVVWEVWEKNLIQKLVVKTLWDFFFGGVALLVNMVVPMEQRHAEGGSAMGPGRVTIGSSTRSIESTLPKE